MKCPYCGSKVGEPKNGWINCPRCKRAQFIGQKALVEEEEKEEALVEEEEKEEAFDDTLKEEN